MSRGGREQDRRRAVVETVVGVAGLILIAAVVLGWLLLRHSAVPIAAKGTHGYDVSWPQCSGSDARTLPPGSPAYVILGLTDVGDHTVNPCLGSQLDWARSHGVRVGAYLVATYPNQAQQAAAGNGLYGSCGTATLCRLRNDGAAQAAQALATMKRNGVGAPRVWLDVETRTLDPWSANSRRNTAVLRGIVRGLRLGHVALGVYSTAYMWEQIAGDYQLRVPNWLPSGDAVPRHAEALCGTSATSGPTWLVQYTRSLDSDLTCPALDATPDAAASSTPGPTNPPSARDLRLSRFARAS